MKKEKIRSEIESAVKNELRKGKISSTADILESLPDIIEAVGIDREYVNRRIRRAINADSKNPINGLLGLMGMRIIHTGTANEIIEDKGSSDFANNLYAVNGAKLTASISSIADKLAEHENSSVSAKGDVVARLNDMTSALEDKNNEYNQLKTDFAFFRRNTVNTLQGIAAGIGRDNTNASMSEIEEFMKLFGMELCWEQNEEKTRFTELKVGDTVGKRVRPCVLKDGEVYEKGIMYVKAVE